MSTIKIINCKKVSEVAKELGLTKRRIYQLVKNRYLDILPLTDKELSALPIKDDSIIIEVNHKYKMLLEIYGDKSVKRRNLKNRTGQGRSAAIANQEK